MKYDEEYARRLVRSIYFNDGVKRSSTLQSDFWERELGISRLNQVKLANAMQHNNATRKKQSWVNFVRNVFKSFCDNTSMHGFKYITADSTCILERLLWFVICCGAVILTCTFLKPIFTKYFAREIITTIRSTDVPIWEVEFPAVTICNVNKASKSLIEEAAKKSPWSNYSLDTVREVIDFMALFGQIPVDEPHPPTPKVIACADEQNQYIDSLMQQVIQPLERMIIKCWWVGTQVNCSEHFQLIRTDEGYCWSFNSAKMKIDKEPTGSEEDSNQIYHDHHSALHQAEYGLRIITLPDSDGSEENEKGNLDMKTAAAQHSAEADNEEVETESPPKVVSGTGSNMGLTVLLNPEIHEYKCNTNNVYGFKVLVHDPEGFPSVAIKAFLVNAGQEIYVPVTPTKVNSTEDIENIPKDQRNCRFDSEMSLRFHDTYTFGNCFLDCQVLSMNKTCGCVPYVYSELRGVQACDFNGMSCVNNNTAKFASLLPDDDPEWTEFENSSESMENCHCPLNCEEITYIPEVTTAAFPKRPEYLPMDWNATREKLSLLRVYFKSFGCVEYRNDLVYSSSDLIAAFGGIVSLVIGFSFVSAAELLYLLTIRPILHFRRYMNPQQ